MSLLLSSNVFPQQRKWQSLRDSKRKLTLLYCCLNVCTEVTFREPLLQWNLFIAYTAEMSCLVRYRGFFCTMVSLLQECDYRMVLLYILTDSTLRIFLPLVHLCSDSFSQGRRRYFVDLRQNQRGRFLKLTMLAGGKTFVAIPGDGLMEFRDALAELLDTHGGEDTSGDMDASGDGGERERVRPGGGGGPRGGGGPPRRGRGGRGGGDGSPPPPPDNLPPSKEIRTGMGKTFYFDVEQNDRGTFVRLSEVNTMM